MSSKNSSNASQTDPTTNVLASNAPLSPIQVNTNSPSVKWGIAEWYGIPVEDIPDIKRQDLLSTSQNGRINIEPCPPRIRAGIADAKCNKRGGVCSLRPVQDIGNGLGQYANGPLVTLCPHRLKDEKLCYSLPGTKILNNPDPKVFVEIPFLERVIHPQYQHVMGVMANLRTQGKQVYEDDEGVGNIDAVLYTEDRVHNTFDWCGVELQSVYFSGKKMSLEFPAIVNVPYPNIPFPVGERHPDFRSSGPKRLLPQLQTKIPSLRRWGKKMVVVVDEAFFVNLSPMKRVNNVSKGDVLWVVLGFDTTQSPPKIEKRRFLMTTLESAVEGLTAGAPRSKSKFERVIRLRRYARAIKKRAKYINDVELPKVRQEIAIRKQKCARIKLALKQKEVELKSCYTNKQHTILSPHGHPINIQELNKSISRISHLLEYNTRKLNDAEILRKELTAKRIKLNRLIR